MSKFKIHIALSHDDEGSFRTFCGINSDNASENFWDEAKLVDKLAHEESTCKTCKKAISAYFIKWIKEAEKLELEFQSQKL